MAWELGQSPASVRAVIEELVGQITKHLVLGRTVNITKLGKLSLYTQKSTRIIDLTNYRGKKKKVVSEQTIRVSFAKSPSLKEALMSEKDEGMDKFAVDETLGLTSDELEKKAAEGCPVCGRKLAVHGKVLICPVHGSEPFEGK